MNFLHSACSSLSDSDTDRILSSLYDAMGGGGSLDIKGETTNDKTQKERRGKQANESGEGGVGEAGVGRAADRVRCRTAMFCMGVQKLNKNHLLVHVRG